MDSKNQIQKREIKFRAWDSDRKEMIYFDNFKVEDTGGFWGGDREVWQMSAYFGRGDCDGLGYFNDEFSQKSDVELMRFTGLKDKNGKDIYEGDILQVCNGSINGNGWYDKPYSVEFKAGKWDIPLFMWDNNGQCIMDNTHWCEIIGNIHENGELIKSNQ